MTRGIIKAIAQTYLKGTTQQASEIQDKSSLIVLRQGEEIKCDLLGEANGHYCLDLDNKQWFVSKFHVSFAADAGFTPREASYLRLTRTNKKDQFGCIILRLQRFRNGVCVDEIPMRSGQARVQNFRKGADSKSGSYEPLPEGRWKIEQIFWAGGKDNYDASHGDGIGPVSVPLTYDGPGQTDRSLIVIHWDANADEGKPGSAGCPVTLTLEHMKRVISWLREDDPKYFYSDWNLGSCPEVFPK